MAWGAGPVFLLSFSWGIAFNVLGGLLLIAVYDRWNSGFPWNVGHASIFNPQEKVFGLLGWAALLEALGLGLRTMLVTKPDATKADGTEPDLIEPAAIGATDGPRTEPLESGRAEPIELAGRAVEPPTPSTLVAEHTRMELPEPASVPHQESPS
jgi:hypothetical protein